MAFLYWCTLMLLTADVGAALRTMVLAWGRWRDTRHIVRQTGGTDYSQCLEELTSSLPEALTRAWVSTILAAGHVLALVYVILSGV